MRKTSDIVGRRAWVRGDEREQRRKMKSELDEKEEWNPEFCEYENLLNVNKAIISILSKNQHTLDM